MFNQIIVDAERETGGEPWSPGTLLGDSYRVERLLGRGGMGVVVAARDLGSGELVAVKLIRPERSGDRAFVKRFLREARIASSLKCDNAVRVLGLGELASGLPYLVMEYLEGGTIDALLRAAGPLPVETAVDYLLQVCEAVAAAHAIGVVHRDLKPGNLFVARGADGATTIKVIDFGISKFAEGQGQGHGQAQPIDDTHLTTTAAPIGSPRYMAPEQLSAVGAADPRTDIWALGVILFEMVTGAHPFAADSVADTYARILRDPAPSMRSVLASVPPGLDAIYRQCCAKEGAVRMPSVADLAVALAPFGSARARASAARIAAAAPAGATTAGPTPPPAPVARRPRPAIVAAALGGVACVAMALALFTHGSRAGSSDDRSLASTPPAATSRPSLPAPLAPPSSPSSSPVPSPTASRSPPLPSPSPSPSPSPRADTAPVPTPRRSRNRAAITGRSPAAVGAPAGAAPEAPASRDEALFGMRR